jgi:hypothetical protein
MAETSLRRASPAQPDDWLTPGRFAVILAGFIIVAFSQVLAGLDLAAFPHIFTEPKTFVIRDFGFFAYPLAHYQRECFWRGELPLWNPYNNCGVPFLAQWNTMPLYPPALFYLLVPLEWSLSCFCLAHLFWAGLGMYFLANYWTENRVGASVAGVMFAFNGMALNLLMWPSHIATYSWMPWVVWQVQRAWREGGRRVPLAAGVGALQMLAGGPETILFTWLLLVGLWGLDFARPQTADVHTRLRTICWRFPAVVCLVAGLAAAQVLPFLDLAAHSQREQGFADARWSMPAWGWANFLVPRVFGYAGKQNLFFQYGQYWTSSYYLGAGAVLLALLGIRLVRERRVRLLTVASFMALLLAWGDETPPSRWVRHLIPQLSFITYPIKYVIVLTFAVPLLGAQALAWFRHAPANRPRRVWVAHVLFFAGVLLALIGVILLWAWRWPFPFDSWPATLRNGLSRALFILVMAAILLLLDGSGGQLRTRILPLLLLLLLWADVWTHEPSQNPAVPAWVYAPNLARKALAMKPQPALGESRAMVSPQAENKFMQLILNDPKDNFLAKRQGYFADCNLLDSVPKVDGFFSLAPRECGELSSALYVSRVADPPQLADFMCVSQVTSPGEQVKWEPRSTFLPLVTAGQRPIFLDDTNALLLLLSTDFDSRKAVLLPSDARMLVSVTNQTTAAIAAQRVWPERVEFEVQAAEPSMVVIAQTYYHHWQAYVDAEKQKLLRANYAFQALEVPRGTHRVRLVYQDGVFAAGAVISGLSCLLCGLGWVLFAMKAKRSADPPS